MKPSSYLARLIVRELCNNGHFCWQQSIGHIDIVGFTGEMDKITLRLRGRTFGIKVIPKGDLFDTAEQRKFFLDFENYGGKILVVDSVDAAVAGVDAFMREGSAAEQDARSGAKRGRKGVGEGQKVDRPAKDVITGNGDS